MGGFIPGRESSGSLNSASVVFDDTANIVAQDGNIVSVVQNGTGDYTVNFVPGLFWNPLRPSIVVSVGGNPGFIVVFDDSGPDSCQLLTFNQDGVTPMDNSVKLIAVGNTV